MIFETQVNGVPCKCRVTCATPEVPMRIYGPGMGDCDPPEPSVFEYEILDRRGRHAPWLEKYINQTVDQRMEEEFAVMKMADYYDPH